MLEFNAVDFKHGIVDREKFESFSPKVQDAIHGTYQKIIDNCML